MAELAAPTRRAPDGKAQQQALGKLLAAVKAETMLKARLASSRSVNAFPSQSLANWLQVFAEEVYSSLRHRAATDTLSRVSEVAADTDTFAADPDADIYDCFYASLQLVLERINTLAQAPS